MTVKRVGLRQERSSRGIPFHDSMIPRVGGF